MINEAIHLVFAWPVTDGSRTADNGALLVIERSECHRITPVGIIIITQQVVDTISLAY